MTPAGIVAARMMAALGIDDPETARLFLRDVVARQLPRLSVGDIRELLDPTRYPRRQTVPGPRDGWTYDRDDPDTPTTRRLPVRDNLDDDDDEI